ncbi:hypothetical protein CC80DRAFT_454356 [Byssothecium circinans]|uniref:Uncharacterized protein n=1 Tax=Byssothecium circinans TaxID=147558 RepID=A0A6A5TG78_9PLEO|nr:hypothetical protein CC80DRAFT_454356 [Byssothecium circinans]
MLELPSPSLRKRRRSDPLEQTGTSQRPSQQQKLNHSSASQPPSAFWDSLTKVWLTKRALRELDRRNHQAAPNPSHSPQKTNWEAGHYADYLSRCTPKVFNNIRVFARHGGPDLSGLRGYREPMRRFDPTMTSGQLVRSQRYSPATTSNTTKTKSTCVYDRNFQQHLTDHAVYPHPYRSLEGKVPAKPENWNEILRMLALPRPSLSPSSFTDGDHENFVFADAGALKKKQVSESLIPVIEGKISDAKYRSGGIPFTNLDPLGDGTPPGNPDVYYGAPPEQLSQKVRNELSGQIIPSTQHDLPIAPNFFLAVESPEESVLVARRLACYNGALGARGMHSLQCYGRGELVYDNNASTITSIYYGGTLKMYTSYVAPPSTAGGRPEYYMHQLNVWCMDGNPETWRQAATAYRNARDWTGQQRVKAIVRANEKANPVKVEGPANDAAVSLASSVVTVASVTEACTMS